MNKKVVMCQQGVNCTGWFCVSTWHRLELSQRKEFQLGKCLHDTQLWAFSQLVIKGEGPWWVVPFLGCVFLSSIREQWSKPGEASQEETSLHGLCISSCILTSFGDEQQYGSVSWIIPFFPNLLLGYDVCAGIETLAKTAHKLKTKIFASFWMVSMCLRREPCNRLMSKISK